MFSYNEIDARIEYLTQNFNAMPLSVVIVLITLLVITL